VLFDPLHLAIERVVNWNLIKEYLMPRKKKILFARELRRVSTEAEQLLWQYLRNRKLLGKKFRRQHVFCGFILDFYCPEGKLGIELDGSIHLKQKEYDVLRQKIIEEQGIRIVRFSNKDIITDIRKVLDVIRKHLAYPSPLDNGEGKLTVAQQGALSG
jgi:very-short-patch-repair endonuclease